MTSPQITIERRLIGPHYPPYVIAEMSGNHNRDLGRALAIIDAAKEAGADAIKLQTYTASTITLDATGPGFDITHGLWRGENLYRLYSEVSTPLEWHSVLFARARTLGLHVFSSPFDETAVALLQSLDCPAYKIASFELVDLPLIECAAATGRPLIMSTGMASPEEISEALATARTAGASEIALLHCVSAYPATAEQANLRMIPELAARYGCVVGLSDHSPGIGVSVASVALGGSIIEKHFTLSRADGGVDSKFSIEPHELRNLVDEARRAHVGLGSANFVRAEEEQANMIFRRSLYAVDNIAPGETLTLNNVRSIRPSLGLAPKYLKTVLGRRATRFIPRGTPLSWDLISGPDDA